VFLVFAAIAYVIITQNPDLVSQANAVIQNPNVMSQTNTVVGR